MSNEVETVPVKTEVVKRKAGRPKKGEIVAKKRGSRELRGRPKGDAAIMNEYKARMLASPKSAKVLEKVFEIALNDEHAGQMAAMKLVLDRIVPASAFDTAKGNNGSAPQITINVSGISAPSIITEEIDNRDIEDIEYKISDTE